MEIVCIACDWQGKEEDLVSVLSLYDIDKEWPDCCPNCQSSGDAIIRRYPEEDNEI